MRRGAVILGECGGNVGKIGLRRLLYKLIKELGEPDSTIVIQKYYYGRSSKEIGEIVSLSSDTVRVKCSRAIKKLRERLHEAGIE